MMGTELNSLKLCQHGTNQKCPGRQTCSRTNGLDFATFFYNSNHYSSKQAKADLIPNNCSTL